MNSIEIFRSLGKSSKQMVDLPGGYGKMLRRLGILGFFLQTFRKILGRYGKIVWRQQSYGQDFLDIKKCGKTIEQLLWMEEILHRLGWLKPYHGKNRSTGAGFLPSAVGRQRKIIWNILKTIQGRFLSWTRGHQTSERSQHANLGGPGFQVLETWDPRFGKRPTKFGRFSCLRACETSHQGWWDMMGYGPASRVSDHENSSKMAAGRSCSPIRIVFFFALGDLNLNRQIISKRWSRIEVPSTP